MEDDDDDADPPCVVARAARLRALAPGTLGPPDLCCVEYAPGDADAAVSHHQVLGSVVRAPADAAAYLAAQMVRTGGAHVDQQALT
jgi:hypothetical protein